MLREILRLFGVIFGDVQISASVTGCGGRLGSEFVFGLSLRRMMIRPWSEGRARCMRVGGTRYDGRRRRALCRLECKGTNDKSAIGQKQTRPFGMRTHVADVRFAVKVVLLDVESRRPQRYSIPFRSPGTLLDAGFLLSVEIRESVFAWARQQSLGIDRRTHGWFVSAAPSTCHCMASTKMSFQTGKQLSCHRTFIHRLP